MQFTSEQSVETDRGGVNTNRSFRKDTFKKNLKALNQSSIALPTVASNQKIGQAPSFYERDLAHNESSLLTAAGESGIDGGPSITVQEHHNSSVLIGNSSTMDNLIARHVGGSSVRHIPKGKYMTNDSREGILNQMHRNSSTVEKPKTSLGAALNVAEMQRRITTNSSSLIDPFRPKGYNNELSSILNNSMRNLATGGEYASGVKILPVIGSEVSLETVSGKPNTHLEKINNKVELTRKDIQNFLVNGSISKAFIQTNKKELQKFIKKQGRSTSEYFKGYETHDRPKNEKPIYGTATSAVRDSNQSMDSMFKNGSNTVSILNKARKTDMSGRHSAQGNTPKLKKRLLGTSTIHVTQDSHNKEGTFSNDVKLEHKLKEKSSAVSNKVLETWINETLTDAYHLDIPGVLTKPEHSNPIHRYGIDRQTLVKAGVSPEEVDRIYRSLFVYSVGFFELLKKILSTTQKNYQIITSIWKVFQVLLEYSCKTDYRILIAEITDKHSEELQQIETTFKDKIQTYKDTEKILKQNMETMREYNDMLEKDRANEKQLRLKLEEEYMQNTKNHEEEVKLRLKFEGKFNTMHDVHRELQIRHERTCKELKDALDGLSKAEVETSSTQNELITLQKAKTEQDSILVVLKEYKQVAEKEIKKKNMILRTAEQQRASATENFELSRYEIQESAKDLNDIKTKMEVQWQELTHLKGLIASNKVENAELELARLKYKGKYKTIKAEFETRDNKIERLQAALSKEEKVSDTYLKELELLRRKTERLDKDLTQLQIDHSEVSEARKLLIAEKITLVKEGQSGQERIKTLNDERHKLLDKLQVMTEMHETVSIQRDRALQLVQNLKNELVTKETSMQGFRIETFKKEDEWETKKRQFKEKIEDLESEMLFKNTQISQFELLINKQNKKQGEMESRGLDLASEISKHIAKISELTTNCKQLTSALNDTQTKLKAKKISARDAEFTRDAALCDKQSAEEIAATLEETVKSLRSQMLEEKAQLNTDAHMFLMKLSTENERNCMAAEECVSRYGAMKTTVTEALEEREKNRDKIQNFNKTMVLVQTLETQKAQLYKEIDSLKYDISQLEYQVTDKNAELVHVKEVNFDKLKEQKDQHNVEINELEQKLQKERISVANLKSNQLKKNREDMKQISELQKALKTASADGSGGFGAAAAAGAGGGRGGRGRGRGGKRGGGGVQVNLMPVYVEVGVQTMRLSRGGTKFLKQQTKQLERDDSKASITISKTNTNEDAIPESDEESEIMMDPDTESVISAGANMHINSSPPSQLTKSVRQTSSRLEPSSRVSGGVVNTQSTYRSPPPAEIQETRTQQFMQWLVDQEKMILERIDEKIEDGEIVTMQDVKKMRGDLRVPVHYRDLVLTEVQLEEIEAKQYEQVEYHQQRAIRRIEEGSVYSSDFEEREFSEYYSTDGEGKDRDDVEVYASTNIQVIRDDVDVDKIASARRTGSFGVSADARLVTSSEDQAAAAAQGTYGESTAKIKDSTGSIGAATSGEETGKGQTLAEMGLLNLVGGSGGKRASAADKLFNHIRAQSLGRRGQANKSSESEEKKYSHAVDMSIPVTQYVIQKNNKNEDIYRRRELVQKRVLKERDEEYLAHRQKILLARRRSGQDMTVERKVQKYNNLYSKFASNYSQTIQHLVEESKDYLRKKAQGRRQQHSNDKVDNISGRENYHYLIKQMKDTPAWQIHLAKLKEELKEQENKWDHKEEELAEIESKRQEILQIEEEVERERSIERKKKTTIVREDLQRKAEAEAGAQQQDEERKLLTLRKMNTSEAQEERTPPQVIVEDDSKMPNLQHHVDIDQFSVWSEDQLQHMLSQRDAMNPQGEEEELKESELQLIMQNSSQQQQFSAIERVDNEIVEMNKGGVAAINRQSEQLRVQQMNEIAEMQSMANEKAKKKDIVLMQRGMVPKKTEEKKKPGKLGPSTIRTLIRAADSRMD